MKRPIIVGLALPDADTLSDVTDDQLFISAYKQFLATLNLVDGGDCIASDYEFFLSLDPQSDESMAKVKLLSALLQPTPKERRDIVEWACGFESYSGDPDKLKEQIDSIPDFGYDHYPIREAGLSLDETIQILEVFLRFDRSAEYQLFSMATMNAKESIRILQDVGGMMMTSVNHIDIKPRNLEWSSVTFSNSDMTYLPGVIAFVRSDNPIRGVIKVLDAMSFSHSGYSW